ncbi:MAG: aldose 1-epimerase [Granulosicoccus sp.]|jgi:aldose 1-epimerase
MSYVLLESDTWRLWCDPTAGVQWMAAEVHREGIWHAIVPECRPSAAPRAGQSETNPLTAANFHMLPYSNRIRDGLFEFQGQTIQLKKAESHAIHGALRKLPWKVKSSDSSSLICQFNSNDHHAVNWPWPISATLEHRVQGDLLTSQITLTNNGDTDMPAGFGWHPYFVRTINGADAVLTLPVESVFPDASGDCLPDGAAVALPESLDFRAPTPLDASQRIDCCLSGLAGQCVLDWQQGGIKLILHASDICQYLVLYNPDMPHFAVEPVTNANDAFNLATQSIESGVNILRPGESLSAIMSLTAVVSE